MIVRFKELASGAWRVFDGVFSVKVEYSEEDDAERAYLSFSLGGDSFGGDVVAGSVLVFTDSGQRFESF